LLTEAAVNGGRDDGRLCQRRSLSTEVAMGWKDNDAMASMAMVSLANGGGSDLGLLANLKQTSKVNELA
jgi:hypothetical protein